MIEVEPKVCVRASFPVELTEFLKSKQYKTCSWTGCGDLGADDNSCGISRQPTYKEKNEAYGRFASKLLDMTCGFRDNHIGTIYYKTEEGLLVPSSKLKVKAYG